MIPRKSANTVPPEGCQKGESRFAFITSGANQAAFVEQIARNDQERLALKRESKARIEAWQSKSEERFARIEAQLAELPKRIVQAVLDQLPRIKKEIGFKTPR
jgi:hypothetical protein